MFFKEKLANFQKENSFILFFPLKQYQIWGFQNDGFQNDIKQISKSKTKCFMNILKVKVENVQNKSSKLKRVTIFKKNAKTEFLNI